MNESRGDAALGGGSGGAETPIDGGVPEQLGDVLVAAESLEKVFRLHRQGRGDTSRLRLLRAVESLNLALHAGEAVALVGESGSGKSTVARLLAGLERPSGGTITYGRERVRLDRPRAARAYRAKVQIVFQDPFASLNPVHRVSYHLARSLQIHRGLRGSELTEVLEAMLERVALSPPRAFLDKFPHELSGGQRQRVAIARALAADPKVILADEPTSMLDVSVRMGILNLLGDLVAEDRLALLYITHDIASARYLASRTLVMYAGRVLEEGPSEVLTETPAHPYTKLLVSAAPDPDRVGVPVRLGARGEPPDLSRPPSGCRFYPRCPVAMDRCRVEVPPAYSLAEGHEVACFLYDQTVAARGPG